MLHPLLKKRTKVFLGLLKKENAVAFQLLTKYKEINPKFNLNNLNYKSTLGAFGVLVIIVLAFWVGSIDSPAASFSIIGLVVLLFTSLMLALSYGNIDAFVDTLADDFEVIGVSFVDLPKHTIESINRHSNRLLTQKARLIIYAGDDLNLFMKMFGNTMVYMPPDTKYPLKELIKVILEKDLKRVHGTLLKYGFAKSERWHPYFDQAKELIRKEKVT